MIVSQFVVYFSLTAILSCIYWINSNESNAQFKEEFKTTGKLSERWWNRNLCTAITYNHTADDWFSAIKNFFDFMAWQYPIIHILAPPEGIFNCCLKKKALPPTDPAQFKLRKNSQFTQYSVPLSEMSSPGTSMPSSFEDKLFATSSEGVSSFDMQ